jgi:predicted permease
MEEELAFHVQARINDLTRSGLSAGEARRRARLEFGGAEQYKEQLRDTRHLGWIEDLFRDLAYAGRNLRRSPLFTLSAAGAIALGIGVNTALFSLVYGVLFRPLPVADPGSIRNVYMTVKGDGGRRVYGSLYFASLADFTYLRDHAKTTDLAGVSEAGLTAPFSPAALHAQLVSDNLLAITGATPVLGRFFTREETSAPGSGGVTVLSYDTWQKYFNGEDVIGRDITLNRTHFTIVGVAGKGFHGPLILKADLWIPLIVQPVTRAGESFIDDPNAAWIQMIGRRKPDRSDSEMLAELQVLGQQTVSTHLPKNRAVVVLSPGAFLNYPDVMSNSVPVLAILFLAVSLVLLVACANVANMLAARGFGRSREIAIRLSVGAARRQLIRQLLTEHILLGLIGGAAGLAFSQITIRALLGLLPPLGDHQLNMAPDWRIAVWTFLVALAAGVMFGLPAAVGMTRGDLAQSLRGDAFEAGGKHGRFRLQNALIVTQVAISALLLINAGLLVRAATHALHMDPGHAVQGVLSVKPNVRDLQYTAPQAGRYLHELRDRAAALPGVTAISWTGFEPIQSSCGAEAKPIAEDGSVRAAVRISCNEVGPGFLRAMGIRLLQGRDFTPADELPTANTVLVDEAFARRYLPGNPLGRRIRVWSPEQERQVVGVVSSTKSLLFLKQDHPEVYLPLTGLRYLEGRLVLSYNGPRAPLVRALQATAAQLDKESSLSVHSIEGARFRSAIVCAAGRSRNRYARGAGAAASLHRSLRGCGLHGRTPAPGDRRPDCIRRAGQCGDEPPGPAESPSRAGRGSDRDGPGGCRVEPGPRDALWRQPA